MPAEQLDQIGHRNAQDGAGEAVLEARDQRGHVATERDAVQPDRRPGLLRPYPGQQSPNVPHRLGGGVHVVHHVLARKDPPLGQSACPRPVHRQDRQHHIQAQVLVQMPGTEQGHVKPSPAHLGTVNAYQPWSRFFVPQHQCILALVALVAAPAVLAGFTRARRVPAVEDDALAGSAGARETPDRDVGQWRGRREEPLRFVQPPALAVEVQRRDHLVVDPRKGSFIADGSAHSQPEKHDLVAKGMRGKRNRGSRNREFAFVLAEVVSPRPRVVAAGLRDGPDQRTQHLRARGLAATSTARRRMVRVVAVGYRHTRSRYVRCPRPDRGFDHGWVGRSAIGRGTNVVTAARMGLWTPVMAAVVSVASGMPDRRCGGSHESQN